MPLSSFYKYHSKFIFKKNVTPPPYCGTTLWSMALSWINGKIKAKCIIWQSFGSIDPLQLLIWWSFMVKILQKIYKTSLILLHVARLKTQLIDVWPAADLSGPQVGPISVRLKYIINIFQILIRRGGYIRPQLSAASPTKRPQPKVIITIVIIKLKLWPAAGCEAKVAAELSSRPLEDFAFNHLHETSYGILVIRALSVISRFRSWADFACNCEIYIFLPHFLNNLQRRAI